MNSPIPRLSYFIIFCIVLLLATAFLGFAANPSYAQTSGAPPSGGIVPCGGPGQDPCNLCHLYKLAKNGIDFMLFGFALPVAVIALLIGGIFLLASRGNPQMMQTGKSAISNTVIGVIIAFSAWLIIGTVLNTLGYENKGFSAAWNEFPTCQPAQGGGPGPGPEKEFWCRPSCRNVDNCATDCNSEDTVCGTTRPPASACSGEEPPAPGPGPGPTPPGTLTHEEAKQQLDDAGITITSSGNCSDKTNGSCTSLDGVRQSTIDGIINVKQECGCNVVVSGGTEAGHSTSGTCNHGNGCKIDMSLNPALDTYVQSTYEPIGQCFPQASACYRSPTGQIWAKESNHWDVAFP